MSDPQNPSGGNPPGVSDLTPGGQKPEDALAQRIKAMEEKEKAWATKEAQYIDAMNRMAEALPAERPAPQEQQFFDDETEKQLEKRVKERMTPLERQLAEQRDQMDSMFFMQTAGTMGATPEQVTAADAQYRAWQKNGERVVDATGNAKVPTRLEALDFVLGRQLRSSMMKEAPQKSMQAFRAQLLGGAAFENPGTGFEPAPTRRSLPEEVDGKPLAERIKIREEFLDKTGF